MTEKDQVMAEKEQAVTEKEGVVAQLKQEAEEKEGVAVQLMAAQADLARTQADLARAQHERSAAHDQLSSAQQAISTVQHEASKAQEEAVAVAAQLYETYEAARRVQQELVTARREKRVCLAHLHSQEQQLADGLAMLEGQRRQLIDSHAVEAVGSAETQSPRRGTISSAVVEVATADEEAEDQAPGTTRSAAGRRLFGRTFCSSHQVEASPQSPASPWSMASVAAAESPVHAEGGRPSGDVGLDLMALAEESAQELEDEAWNQAVVEEERFAALLSGL